MKAVKLSSKYQIVIPKKIRESFDLNVGQKIQVLSYNERIVLIPIKPIKQLRGFLKGMEIDLDRGANRL